MRDTRARREKKDPDADYSLMKAKLYLRLAGICVAAFAIIFAFYYLVWRGRGGDWLLGVLENVFGMADAAARRLYQQLFRRYPDLIGTAAVAVVFLLLLRTVLSWLTACLRTVNKGIGALLVEDGVIALPPEMAQTQRKLLSVQSELQRRAAAAAQANQRKNELVMYLAHDIRTPLTSVIGYLELMADAPDMPAQQREKCTRIALDKANRLEKMVNEFFDITRYDLQQIDLHKERVDLAYLLIQLADEMSPLLAERGNRAVLHVCEELAVCGDPEQLARVFHNVLRNAAAYSYPDTPIDIFALEEAEGIKVAFQNAGRTIPQEKLGALFEKFYRLDDARTSFTGGAGLGLAIAKEIVTLHGGTIEANSQNETVTFTITLPKAPS